MHIHGHEFYVMQKGYGKLDPGSLNMFPNGSHPAFECTPGVPYCATTDKLWSDDKFNLHFENMLKKTTVTIPTNGWTIVRFKGKYGCIYIFWLK